MSRPVTDLLSLSTWLEKRGHLDIGRTQLTLRDGKSQTCQSLPQPLRSSLPDSDQLATLRAALEMLCRTLPAGRRHLDITISDSLARCWILERLPGLATLAEIEALAADQMQQLYGDSADAAAQWALQIDVTPFATQWPVIALPKAWLDLLIEITAARAWRIGKIQTRFVASLNEQRSNPFRPEKNSVYALETLDGLTIGIRTARQWLALRTHPPLNLLGADLLAMLRRDCAAAGVRLDDLRIHSLSCPLGVEAGVGAA